MVYVGSSHERLLNRGPLVRAEGPYAFHRGAPTEVAALKTDGARVLPDTASLGEDTLWATDNMDYYKTKAEKNPGQWAYFTRRPSPKQLAALLAGLPVEEEPDEKDPGKPKETKGGK